MAVSILNQFFDINMLAAIAAEPNGITITGHLFQMLSLATKDPEGCVRLVPNSYMDAVSFARIFNCTVALVLDSIRTLQKLGIVSVEDGMLFINQLRKAFQDKRAAKAEAEMKKAKAEETRRKTNARVKKCRAIKKTGLEANTTPGSKAETEIFSETKVAVSEMEPGNGDCPAPTKTKYATNSAPENETETMNDAHRNTMETHADTIAEKRAASNTSENETEPCNVDCNALLPVPAKKRKKQRKEIINNIYNNSNTSEQTNNSYSIRGSKKRKRKFKTGALLPDTETETLRPGEEGCCLPFVPGESEEDENRMMPLDELSESCRKILEAWNRLRIKTFYGLYPALRKKAEALLQRYDADTVVQGIANIAKSEFLLGRRKYKHFTVTLGWLLQPGNFAKVLAGKYNNKTDDDLDDMIETPFYLPGETDAPMTPEERRKELHEMMHPHTPELEEAAKLLGIQLD